LGVREGIVKHSSDYSAAEHPELADYILDQRPPLEAQLIDLADEIAYTTADLDDGLDSGILTLEQVREGVPLFRGFHDAALRRYPAAALKLIVNEALKSILNALVTDLLNEVPVRVKAIGATTLAEIRQAPERLATLSEGMEAERAAAKRFLYANLYNSAGMDEAHAHAETVVEGLFAALIADPGLLPEDHRLQIPTQGLARTAADYIAGMTDSYIEEVWGRCGGV
jgi:dGTPase